MTTTPLRWSKYADGAFLTPGECKLIQETGDATRVGYITLACWINRHPDGFHQQDIEKAQRVLDNTPARRLS